MKQTVKDYELIEKATANGYKPLGNSAAPKEIIFHILKDNTNAVEVLDIGFGTGSLGSMIKTNSHTQHWQVDGIDGWEANCLNSNLLAKNIYRNIWHGLAQELPSEIINKYKILCLIDVIEHLNTETAKWLLRTLLTCMGKDSFLLVSTPLWFYPQDQMQEGDLEEHLIGVPATSMLSLLPIMYSINNPLVGGFVLSKRSLKYIDFFHPTSNKSFDYEMGLSILRSLNIDPKPGVLYKNNI